MLKGIPFKFSGERKYNYHYRHLKPEDANYNAPLFLDCCGLVRKVMTDLKEDFGFQIGGWNQVFYSKKISNSMFKKKGISI